jgi:hypothetical protein
MPTNARTLRRAGFRLEALMLAGLMLVAGGGAVLAQETSPEPAPLGPDTPVMTEDPGVEPLEDGPIPAEPDPSMVDQVERAWEYVLVGPDGRTLSVHFWNGVETCYGLARVEVSRGEQSVDIRLWTGTRPEAVDMACIEIAQMYRTEVVLDEPILGGGYQE